MANALTRRRPKKWLAEELRCRSIQLSITLPVDAFDLSYLSHLEPTIEGTDFSKSTSVTGPLKLGGSGRDDFRITASLERHDTEVPHYHIFVHGVASKGGVTPVKDWPKITDFFDAVASGLSRPDEADALVIAQHRYPREWWTGAMDLPIPLPSTPGKTQTHAELTGLEISYESESGTEVVLLSARDGVFQVFISFQLSGPIGRDLFTTALRRSASIGGRLFNDDTLQTNDE